MTTPYDILGVTAGASDAEIKQAYLQKVKDNPPDRDRVQFQTIYDAYTAIKDHKSRISYALFSLPEADFDILLDQAFDITRALQLTPEHFNQLLQASINDSAYLNSLSHCKQKT